MVTLTMLYKYGNKKDKKLEPIGRLNLDPDETQVLLDPPSP